ncbi:MAG: glycerol-3-phosphate dehydrogenase/oxidase [Bacteriovoracaceae bacterium]
MGKQKIEERYDTIVVGGGVVGAGIFRELVLRQEKTLLLDKGDFSSQTSQSSSKMLHGGIRYLENFDFTLVWEALREKNLWTKLAPRLTKEEMFYIPVYKESKWPLFFVRVGLFLYDLLSFFKNPKRRTLSAAETLQELPGLKSANLRGAGVYSDAVVEDSKLALECIYDGLGEFGQALNYHEVQKVEKTDKGHQVLVRNTLNGSTKRFHSKSLVFATGPFTDQLFKKLKIPWKPKMILSKGSHLWLKQEALNISHPMVLQTSDNRVIFVIPQRNAILVGTTEKALDPDENIFNIQASQEEIDYLLKAVNQYFPKAQINAGHILSTFAGVRPLVAQNGKERGKVSRKHQIFTPIEDMYVVVGGKYTTFRVMAQDVVKAMYKKQGRNFQKDLSLRPLKRHSVVGMIPPKNLGVEEVKKIVLDELPQTVEDVTRRRLSLLNSSQLPLSPAQIERVLEELKKDG